MADVTTYSTEKDDSLNVIYYALASQILKELLEKEFITAQEYYQVDDLNRVSFYQDISTI